MTPATDQLKQPDDTDPFFDELEAKHDAEDFEQLHQQRLADGVAAALAKLKDE